MARPSGPRTGTQTATWSSFTVPRLTNLGSSELTVRIRPQVSITCSPNAWKRTLPPDGSLKTRSQSRSSFSPSHRAQKPWSVASSHRYGDGIVVSPPNSTYLAVVAAQPSSASQPVVPGTVAGWPEIARAASRPEATAASMQPPSMPFRVQSPASARLRKPDVVRRQAVRRRAREGGHVLVARVRVRAPVLAVEALFPDPGVRIEQHVPIERGHALAAPEQRVEALAEDPGHPTRGVPQPRRVADPLALPRSVSGPQKYTMSVGTPAPGGHFSAEQRWLMAAKVAIGS